MTDIDKWSQDLNDLIWQRERLNADLTDELKRTKALADAVTRLKSLNSDAESVVRNVLSNLEPRPLFTEEDPYTDQVANRFAPAKGDEELRRVVNGSYGVN